MELFEELKWRGLVDNVTSEEVEDVINNGEVTFYIGTDPTADSLHIGHYSSLLMAKRLEKHHVGGWSHWIYWRSKGNWRKKYVDSRSIKIKL